MRKYIRHPSDIPIDFDIDDIKIHDREFLNDISFGGLSFCSKTRLKAGVVITIKISLVKPGFECQATVKWCRKHGDFDMRPNNHVRGKQRCHLCGSGKKRTTEDFITPSSVAQ